MKKFYLLLTVIFISGYVNSQPLHNLNYKNYDIHIQNVNLNSSFFNKQYRINQNKGNTDFHEWYSYAIAWEDSLKISNNLTGSTLFPDSTVYSGTDGNLYNPYIHAIANLFDPLAPVFKNNKINTKTLYKVDSLAFFCLYNRNTNDSNIVDTLEVELITNLWPPFYEYYNMKPYYGQDSVTWGRILHDSKSNFYKSVNDNWYLPAYTTNVHTYKIPLTEATIKDTIQGGVNLIYIPTPTTTYDSLLTATTYRFIPGYKYKKGDSIYKQDEIYFLSYAERGFNKYPIYKPFPTDLNVSYIIPSFALQSTSEYLNDYVPNYYFDSSVGFQNHWVGYKISYNYCPCAVEFNPNITKTITSGDKTELNTIIDACNTGVKYKWAPTTGLSSTAIGNPLASPVVTTTYTVTMTAPGCTASNKIKITVNPLTANAGLNRIITCGDTVHLNVKTNLTNGIATYKWTPSSSLSSSTIANPVASPNATTTYKVTVTAGTSNATGSVTITVNPLFTANAGSNKTISCGDSLQLNVITIPSQDNAVYNWSPNTSLSATDISNPTAFPTENTTYMVTVSLSGGNSNCSPAETQVTVNVGKPHFKLNFTADNTSLYSEPPYTVQFTNLTPKLGKYKFTWNFGDGTSKVNSNNLNVSHQYQLNGNYTVTLLAIIPGSVCGGDTLKQEGFINCSSPGSVPVGNIVITPDTLKIGKSKSASFNVNILPSNATNKTVIWSIADVSLAFVDNTGLATGLNYGITNVTAITADGGFTSNAIVKVVNTDGIFEYTNQNSMIHNCYPNPFENSTIINYILPENTQVSMKIYDMVGNEIKTLVNENKNKGDHNVSFDATGLERGIYYYKINTLKNSVTGKMTLIR